MAKGGMRGRTLPERLTKDELERLLAAPSLRAPTGLRDHVLMRLMAYGGLRCDEVLRLRVSDIRDGEVHLGRDTDATQRTATLDPHTRPALQLWLERRPSGSSDRVFVTLQGKPLSDRYVRAMVEREAESVGLDRPVVMDGKTGRPTRRRLSPHTLRHTAACLALEDLLSGQPVQGGRESEVWFRMDGCAVGELPQQVAAGEQKAELATLKRKLAAITARIAKLEAEP